MIRGEKYQVKNNNIQEIPITLKTKSFYSSFCRSPESSLKTMSASDRPEPLTNPLEMLRGTHMAPDSEELLEPEEDTWSFFGLTIDSTVTRVIADLETQRLVDPKRTATLVLDGCRPTAAVPQPPCPPSEAGPPSETSPSSETSPPTDQVVLGAGPAGDAGVAMATQPLPTVTASGQGATTSGGDDPGQTGGATTDANWRESQGGADNAEINAVAGETILSGGVQAAQEIKDLTTPHAEFTEAPATTEAVTMEELEEEKQFEESTVPAPVTMRLNLRVRDAVPTEIAHGMLVVKPQSKEEIVLPNLDAQKERVEVRPLVPADMDIFSDTVDAVRQLVDDRERNMHHNTG